MCKFMNMTVRIHEYAAPPSVMGFRVHMQGRESASRDTSYRIK